MNKTVLNSKDKNDNRQAFFYVLFESDGAKSGVLGTIFDEEIAL